jgi:Double zinc ribbon
MKTCPACQQTYTDDDKFCFRDGSRLDTASLEERECPYCAERILKMARVCKHCGRDVEPLAGTGIAAQAPSPSPPQGINKTPAAQAQASKPATAKPPHLRVTEGSSRAKHVVPGLVLLAVIAGGNWHLSPSSPEPPANVTSQSPDKGTSTVPANLAQREPRSSGQEHPAARVPFVGCSSDGQVGPVAAPTDTVKVVQIDGRAARRLAYYKAESSSGVLAPRGWYCFGLYGSAGDSLYVAPQPVKFADFLSTTWHGFTGPAIQASVSIGGTSGRFEVARVMARVFPAQKAFVQNVINEGIWPASQFVFGPYPKDKLIFQSDRVVEYQTPPHAEGLGTTTNRLPANDDPINGVAILEGENPDLLSLGVRLPPDMNDLASPIIQQIERENAPPPDK